jgi:mannose-6-phosphate isomerase-like protein (cupin superfamily)
MQREDKTMSLHTRRVVTGHDAQGRAKVLIDEPVKNVSTPRPGAHYNVIWTSEGFPIDNNDDTDPSTKKISTAVDNGTVFRVVRFDPGVAPRNHRTDSIDYGVVISGEIDMELDVETVHLKAGDVIVQRGTIHNWANNGSVPCVIAFTLIAAKPATPGGKPLTAQG